jgi:4-hydroxybenzoate polyprenyltransferase
MILVKSLLSLLRPKQWVKNSFVLAPLIFSGSFMNEVMISKALLVMLMFCVASSAGYIVNDMYDVDYDRKHPNKSKNRPIASGAISMLQASVLLLILYGLLALYLWVNKPAAIVLWGYIVLNIAYTFQLKHMPVIDIFTIAIGFVLRVYGGAVGLGLAASHWMFVTTLSLALFLAAIKRRQELMLNGTEGRKVLKHYSFKVVDRFAEMAATGALLFYSLFVMTVRQELIITIPLVLFGLFRYWYIVDLLQGGESPTDVLLTDIQLMLTIALWVSVSAWALWTTAGPNNGL